MTTSVKALQPEKHEHFELPRLSPAANNNVAIANKSDSNSSGTEKLDLETFKLQITENSRIDRSYGWAPVHTTVGEFGDQLCTHEKIEKKNGRGFVPGVIQGDRRKKTAVSQLTALVLDLDKGENWKKVGAAIDARGHYAIAYTTFSDLSRETEIKIDAYRKFVGSNEVNSEGLRKYLTEVTQYRPWVVEQVEVASDYRDTADGAVCVARHAPLPKLRIVFPLLNPLSRREVMAIGGRQEDFELLWKAKYAAFADSLGVVWDQSCSDVSRCFFYPSCRVGCTPRAEKFEGPLLDLDTIDVEISPDGASAGKNSSKNCASQRCEVREHTIQGSNMKAWVAQYGSTFEIESAIRTHKDDAFFGPKREQGGVHIDCPFEDEHNDGGGTGTFVVNASDNEGHAGFGIHCCHNSCLTRRGNATRNSVDRLLFIRKMLEDGSLTLEDLQNPELGGGPISARVYHDNRCSSASDNLHVIDEDGKGIDASIFHASMIAKNGLLDFARLNQLCGTQIGPDVTAKQLADFIESRRVTVAQLVECAIQVGFDQEDDDPYAQKLKTLALKKVTRKLLDHQIDKQLGEIAKEFNTKQKTIEKDFKRFEQQVRSFSTSSELGILSVEDTALIKPMRDYVKDFAIINTGGKGVVMALQQPDISKAIMPRNDFEFLHQNEWVEVVGEDRSITTVFPAQRFLAKPPKDAQFYRGGFVFKPEGTVSADEYNLYRGMHIEPAASGSCSMLYELIRDVWAQGDEQITEWVQEYLKHIVAYPGQKVGTSIAIRGGPGDGKSIVCEQLMSKILGDMLLRVANQKMILGDFNEALIGKLLTVLEEAAFAGDKAAFDKMKELITGEKVLINPKFKAPIIVNNYSRLIVISNHDHFLHIKPGDRRYTVLESTSAWQGSNKFEQLIDQWENGGAERFVYEALNHSFRRFDDRQTLVINTNLKTDAAVRQMAQSRSALEKCVVGFILSGAFKSAKSPYYDQYVETGTASNIVRWKLDEPLDIQSQVFERSVTSWLREFDFMAAKHESSLHGIIDTLQRFVGDIEASRPKGVRDASTGKRPQLATVRRLPPRRQAIRYAWDNGLITDEEYGGAIPEPKQPSIIEGSAWEDDEEAFPFPMANTG